MYIGCHNILAIFSALFTHPCVRLYYVDVTRGLGTILYNVSAESNMKYKRVRRNNISLRLSHRLKSPLVHFLKINMGNKYVKTVMQSYCEIPHTLLSVTAFAFGLGQTGS